MHNIGEWFGPYDNQQKRFDHIDQFNKTINSVSGIIKSHCDIDLFCAHYLPFPVIYVVRDPRDVMVSWWHYLNNDNYYANNPVVSDHRSGEFYDFISRNVSDFLRFSYSLKGDFENVVDRWASHVAGWGKCQTLLVRYEDIKFNLPKTLVEISQFLHVDLTAGIAAVRLSEGVSHLRRKGIVGDWINVCKKQDLIFIDKIIKEKLEGLYFSPKEVENPKPTVSSAALKRVVFICWQSQIRS